VSHTRDYERGMSQVSVAGSYGMPPAAVKPGSGEHARGVTKILKDADMLRAIIEAKQRSVRLLVSVCC